MRPTVVHCKHKPFDTYIGRAFGGFPASKWANPFVIGKHGTRDEVIAKYAEWIKGQPDLMAAIPELRGQTLGCWCKPENACHGDVLAKMVQDEITQGTTSKEIIPCFTSEYSIAESILTLAEAGKTEPGNPVSICDIAQVHGLKQVVLVESRIDGFIQAYRNLSKIGVQLIYGIKICVCADMDDKSEESLKTESNIIIFIKNSAGYSDLVRLYNRAWTQGLHHKGRIDWKTLHEFWTTNLSLALPFFSSFLQRNTLTLSNIVPDFPAQPTLLREVDSGLPFAPILDTVIDKFAAKQTLDIQPVKSIYYAEPARFEVYQVYRALNNHSELARPNVDHLCSNRFSFQAWKELTGGVN